MSEATVPAGDKSRTHDQTVSPRSGYQWLDMAPFIACHLAVFFAFVTGVTAEALITCAVLYVVRMWAVTAGYHRYFGHRTFKTSRWFQFVLAFVAQTSAQRGVLWWAAHHRAHHLFSDTERDLHSPIQRGFWHSHMLWVYAHNDETDWKRIRDFAKFPELVWLNRFWLLPPVALAAAVTLLFGWSGLVIGFFLSTVLVWHGTFTINSLSHVFGSRRYPTDGHEPQQLAPRHRDPRRGLA
jgi:stearoyl-CoA desaturase (delta-9 desaturase)